MLPSASDNGARLAAILPTGLAAMAKGLGRTDPGMPDALPAIRSLILVVVDGLGTANLRNVSSHAPMLATLSGKRVETVIPSTTGAALTTLATGKLPGAHGLVGYRIRHPEYGLRSTLKGWEGIEDVREWQLAEPLWGRAADLGARAVAIGRPAHAEGGLTRAILSGAEYIGGQTIEDRFAHAAALVRNSQASGSDPQLMYLYVDELDKAAHSAGWQSELWLRRLRALDASLDGLLRVLPADVGLVVTADHGVIDVPPERRLHLDELAGDTFASIAAVGGEPRFRSLYLEPGADPRQVADDLAQRLGKLAWVGLREEAISGDWFGPMAPRVAPRLGEILVVARASVAFTLSDDSPESLAMVGQHGGLSAEERGIPLLLAGALAGSGFGRAVAQFASRDGKQGSER